MVRFVGHHLRSWSVTTWRHVVDIDVSAGVVTPGDVPTALELLDDVLAIAYGDRDQAALDVVDQVFRTLERRGAPNPGAASAEREAREALQQHVRSGHLALTGQTRLRGTTRGDELMNPFEDLPASDPPPPPTTFFVLRLVDEVGDPIDGIEIDFEVLGEHGKATTDGSGRARLDGMEGASALATIPSPSRVREKLQPRWSTPRTPAIPESTPEAPVETDVLDDHLDPVALKKEVETTLVILPRFACRGIAATTFDFGRSFVRREAIVPMASIAQELHQDDGQLAWLFGHTDLSGPEKLNKRLSERRAEALFAVFTHDFARWDALWKGEPKGSPWSESWGTREVQHMLNALGCTDDAGKSLGEDGDNGTKTKQAVRRFKRKDYPTVPAEQADLPDDSKIDAAFREQLFFAYAKLVGREPVDAARFAKIGSAAFMGCGEFNPLSLSAKDRESRRAVVFIFDPAAQPQAPPCVLGSIDACKPTLDPVPDEGAPPPYTRCSFYRTISGCCQSTGGADLVHDVIVRFFMDLKSANPLSHEFVLEAEDMPGDDSTTPPFEQRQSLGKHAREVVAEGGAATGDDAGAGTPPPADAPAMVELHFTHVPDAAMYRLRVEGTTEPYTVFDHTPFHMISELSAAPGVPRMPRLWAILHAPPPPDPFGP